MTDVPSNAVSILFDAIQGVNERVANHAQEFRKEFASLRDQNTKDIKELITMIHETKLSSVKSEGALNAKIATISGTITVILILLSKWLLH